MRVFGCLCFVTITGPNLDKLQPKALFPYHITTLNVDSADKTSADVNIAGIDIVRIGEVDQSLSDEDTSRALDKE
ncbi:hypothetical protein LIER_19903 [Lithospermum erythrorhizon]|uniref:Uncharacterized protein n=1 Tax=Lithospermum erythrorhizon TaxID=34254 RepID=A0AAV3QKJ9_LITER